MVKILLDTVQMCYENGASSFAFIPSLLLKVSILLSNGKKQRNHQNTVLSNKGGFSVQQFYPERLQLFHIKRQLIRYPSSPLDSSKMVAECTWRLP